jgi:hypothetical protein
MGDEPISKEAHVLDEVQDCDLPKPTTSPATIPSPLTPNHPCVFRPNFTCAYRKLEFLEGRGVTMDVHQVGNVNVVSSNLIGPKHQILRYCSKH